MHILIVTPHFWPENFRINDFAKGLMERGHKITVLTATPDYPNRKFYKGYGWFRKSHEQWESINIYRIPVIPRGKGKNWQLFLNYLTYVISGCIYVLVIKKDFDIIFVYETSPITIGIPAIVIKKINKIPIVFWVLDLWPESVSAAGNLKSNVIPKLLMPMVRWIYKNCDKILVSSRGFISSIMGKGVAEEKIDYFPQWAESVFKPINHISNEIDLDFPDGFKVLFAGNIGEAQDFESILSAAELLHEYKNIHWIILGDGRRFDFVKGQIKVRNLEKNFHLLGKFPLESMPTFYAKADVLLLTLKKEYIFSLTVPAKLQSYLACGRPILTMLDGEGSVIVNNANAGLTCEAGDYHSLAKNVLYMYGLNKEEINKYCDNARQYYLDNFDRNKLLTQIEKTLLSFYSK